MCNGGAIQIEIHEYDFNAPMSRFNSFFVVIQPSEWKMWYFFGGSFVCDEKIRWEGRHTRPRRNIRKL